MSRFEKSKEIVRLALAMSASREGVSLVDIQGMFTVSRRTAERMRDAIIDLFPGDAVRESTGDDRTKRWSLQSTGRNAIGIEDLITFDANEISTIEAAAKLLESEGLGEGAYSLRAMRNKIQAMMRPDRLRMIEPDVEALAEAEGIAMRPGPRPKIDNSVLMDLRSAILMSKKVVLHYRARGTGVESRQPVHPYGFLYGNRHYLVAFNENEVVNDTRLFSLSNISRVDVLDAPFEKPRDFSLDEYVSRSFGVFQEEPFDVVMRFSSDVAEDVHHFMFHPSQKMEDEPGGSVIVRLHAGGALEMVWHLFTWGDSVEILEPRRLRNLMDEWCGWGEE